MQWSKSLFFILAKINPPISLYLPLLLSFEFHMNRFTLVLLFFKCIKLFNHHNCFRSTFYYYHHFALENFKKQQRASVTNLKGTMKTANFSILTE